MATLTVTLDYGEPRLGVWCPTCCLPATISVDVLHVTRRGVSVLTTATACRTCGPLRRAEGG